MDYYSIAEDNLETIKVLLAGRKYMQAVYYSCLASEMYLKSKHLDLFSLSRLSKTHDVIGLYRDLKGVYAPSKELDRTMVTLRKYFNESRYPATGTEIYTKEFAEQFLNYALDVKYYIDNDCTLRRPAMKKAILTIKGMSCTHCSGHVKKALLALPGVKEASADHAAGSAEVVFEGDLTEAVLSSAVDEEGYELTGVMWENA